MWNLNQAVGKSAVCNKPHCDLQSVDDLLERNFFERQKACIADVFETFPPRSASYDETSQGRKWHLLTISFSPDNFMCAGSLCLYKTWKGLGKIRYQFSRLSYMVLRTKSFKKCTKWPILMWNGLWFMLDSWLHGKIYFTKVGWLNVMSQSPKRPKSSNSPDMV